MESGDIAWMLMSTALVVFMVPGLALFYGGMVRSKNVLNMLNMNTYCLGMAASMGAVLLCAGAAGKRYALPNAHVMIHQVSGGAQGTASDVERTVEFMYGLKKRLNGIIAHHTGKTAEEIETASDRDNYMIAADAAEFKLIDKVLEAPIPGGVLDKDGDDEKKK